MKAHDKLLFVLFRLKGAEMGNRPSGNLFKSLFGLTGDQALALVVRTDRARFVALPDPKLIEAAGDEVLDGDRPLAAEAISTLRGLLVRPLELGKDVERVLVSTTGRLGCVPFSLSFPAVRSPASSPARRTVCCEQSGGSVGRGSWAWATRPTNQESMRRRSRSAPVP